MQENEIAGNEKNIQHRNTAGGPFLCPILRQTMSFNNMFSSKQDSLLVTYY